MKKCLVPLKVNHMYHEKEANLFLFWPPQFCPDTTRFCVCIKIDKWTKTNIIQHSVMVFNVFFPFASLYYKAFHWICVKVFGGIYCRFDSNHAFPVLRSIISRHNKVLFPFDNIDSFSSSCNKIILPFFRRK